MFLQYSRFQMTKRLIRRSHVSKKKKLLSIMWRNSKNQWKILPATLVAMQTRKVCLPSVHWLKERLKIGSSNWWSTWIRSSHNSNSYNKASKLSLVRWNPIPSMRHLNTQLSQMKLPQLLPAKRFPLCHQRTPRSTWRSTHSMNVQIQWRHMRNRKSKVVATRELITT